MTQATKAELEQRVLRGAREYGINAVLFRHVVGARLGLNVTDMECLAVLFHRGLATPKELAAYTGLSSGATTAMLDRLERVGLIERRPNPKDRRGTMIVIVEEAAERVVPLFASVRDAQAAVVGPYSTEELSVIADFFERSVEMWEVERRKLREMVGERETATMETRRAGA
jgi:DNA-binding MarR family transcriptional regulator